MTTTCSGTTFPSGRSRRNFVVIHPRRGLMILETKDWHLETVVKAGKQAWDILPDGRPKTVINPLQQARHCAIQVINALERDPPLVHSDGPHQGKLAFPYNRTGRAQHMRRGWYA